MRLFAFLVIIIAGALPAAAQSHTARNSLDWSGTYAGTIPCADCEGIGTEITLFTNGTYASHSLYLGKASSPFSEYGWFRWGAEGNTVLLAGVNSDTIRYRVGEGKLTMLDRDGRLITGALAERYVLQKRPLSLGAVRWRLTSINGKTPGTDAPFLSIDTAAKRVSGSAGCNRFSGPYVISANGRISFGPLAVTKMACEEMETERMFLDALGKADGYILRGDRLQLIKARMAPLAEFTAEEKLEGPVTTALLQAFVGAWDGSLTYRDYSSGKEVNIPVVMEVSRAGENAYRRAVSYPKEPHMNGTDTIRLGSSGWSIDDETVRSVRRAADGTVTIVTELQGTDGNDRRPATFRFTYRLNDTLYAKRKEVQFSGTSEWLTRHEYRYTRRP